MKLKIGGKEKKKDDVKADGWLDEQIKKATLYIQEGKVSEGVDIFERIAEKLYSEGKKKEAATMYFIAGQALQEHRRWDESAALYEKAGAQHKVPEVFLMAAQNSKGEEQREYYKAAGRAYVMFGASAYSQIGDEQVVSKLVEAVDGDKNAGNRGRKKPGKLELEIEEGEKGHAGKAIAASFFMLAGFIFALILFSVNFTGFAVFDVSKDSSNFMGAFSFVIGLIGMFFYIKNRK
jgi:tetratricopeptide (TPR) repeat protein